MFPTVETFQAAGARSAEQHFLPTRVHLAQLWHHKEQFTFFGKQWLLRKLAAAEKPSGLKIDTKKGKVTSCDWETKLTPLIQISVRHIWRNLRYVLPVLQSVYYIYPKKGRKGRANFGNYAFLFHSVGKKYTELHLPFSGNKCMVNTKKGNTLTGHFIKYTCFTAGKNQIRQSHGNNSRHL